MFISESDAQKRLNDPKNLFSNDSDAPVDPVVVPELVDGDEDHEPEEDFDLPCLANLDNLDQIINSSFSKRRAQYKGKIRAQEAIGEVDNLLGNSAATALFGASQPQTFAYGEGLRSSNEEMGEVPGLKQHLGQVKMQIAMTASRRVRSALNKLNGAKIRTIEDPMKLSIIAKDMASIVDKMSPRGIEEVPAQLHIYRPETTQVNQYNIVNVHERSEK